MGTLTLMKTPTKRPSKIQSKASLVEEVWEQCQAAAYSHGKNWSTLTDSRKRAMAACLVEHGANDGQILVDAIHGAWKFFGEGKTDFNATKYLVPETIYRKCNFTKYLEEYQAPTKPEGGQGAQDRSGNSPRRSAVRDAVQNILGEYEIQDDDIPF